MDLISLRKIRGFVEDKGEEWQHTSVMTSRNMSDIEQVFDKIVIVNRGTIFFDGNTPDLGRRNGDSKQIRVLFGGRWSVDRIRNPGRIQKTDGEEVLGEVEHDRGASVAAHLFVNSPVKDISVIDPPLEMAIESVCRQSRAGDLDPEHGGVC